nr:hypothetical protein [Tanacetum cinerariifolium]
GSGNLYCQWELSLGSGNALCILFPTRLRSGCVRLRGEVWDNCTMSPCENEGFAQIVDFLNANSIKYALIVSPTIYTSCIKQFWTSTKVKTVNEDVRIQALVDGKKVIVNEAAIRRDLRLDDAEGLNLMINNLHQRPGAIRGRINDEEMFGVHDLIGDEVVTDTTTGENVEQGATVAVKEVSVVDPVTTASEVVTTTSIEVSTIKVTTAATTPQISKDELTLAQTLIQIKAAKPKAITTAATTTNAITRPKAIGVIVQEPSEFRTTPSPQPSKPKEKGKAIMVEPKRPLKRKKQIMMDEQVARELEAQMKAKLEEEARLEDEMKMYMRIVPDDEVAIDAIPLATKPPIIVDWKIIKEGKIS